MIAAASQNFIRINTLNAATGIGTELAEHRTKLIKIPTPVNHRTGHGGTLTAILAIHKEHETSVGKETNTCCLTKDIVLPVPSIRYETLLKEVELRSWHGR